MMRLLRSVLLSSTLLMGATFGADFVEAGDAGAEHGTDVVVEAEGASEFATAVEQLNSEKQVIVQLLGTYLGKLDKSFDLSALGAGDDQLIGILTAMGDKVNAATANLRRLNKAAKEGLAREEAAAERLAALAEEKDAVDAKLAEIVAEIQKVRAAQAEKEKALGTVSGEARELTAQLEAARRDAEAAAQAAAARIEALEGELADAKHTSAEGIAALEATLASERKAAAEGQSAAERAIAEREAALDETRARAEELTGEIEALRAENVKLEARSKTTGATSAKLLALNANTAALQEEAAAAADADSDDEFPVGGSPSKANLDYSGFSDGDRSRDDEEFGADEAEEFVGAPTLDEASLARLTQIEDLRHDQGELDSDYRRLEEAKTERGAQFEETAARIDAVRAEAERVAEAVSELEAALAGAERKIATRSGTPNRRNIIAAGEAAKKDIEPKLTAAREAKAGLDAALSELSQNSEALREQIGQIDADMASISEKFRANQEELEALEEAAAKVGGGDA
ncbi:MAG: hypothetical protein H6492_00225 [Candidatus Paracaedibacteraceae bacterium]|nr:hypothetical protein [Candidatus Paracaedibacteraceae bacterium]